MYLSREEYDKEVKHLEEVKDIIKSVLKNKNENIEGTKEKIVDSKKYLWEQRNEMFDWDLYSFMNEEDEKVDILNKDIIKVYKLYRSLESPYFCRIDFKSTEGVEKFYIGLTGVDRDYDPIVYDWRANVANLYYNYGLGQAAYDTPLGKVEGEVQLRRQFDIKMGKIENVYDASTTIRDSYLEMALGNNTSEYMRNIVGTIQKEQNDCIRFPISMDLIIEGVVGSGKTSIALHRVAYILYNHKDISNENILLFTPNEEFARYISNVLPELGEMNAPSSNLVELARKFIKDKNIESLMEVASKYYSGKVSVDLSREKRKVTLEYKKEIDKYLDEYFKSLKFDKKFGLKTKFLSKQSLNELKDKVPSNLGFCDRIERLSSYICESFHIDEIKNIKKMVEMVRKTLGVLNDPVLLYEEFTGIHLGETINYVDIIGLLYLYFEVMGYPEDIYIKEVVIDEAQDYPPFFFYLVKKMFRNANFTILGDSKQVINPYYNYETLEDLGKIFDAKYKRFDKSYRSSANIIEYAKRIIDVDITAVRQSASKVVERVSEDIKDLEKEVDRFIGKGYQHIGVIVKTDEEKGFIATHIKNVSIEKVYDAKGLEYDAVIVYTLLKNRYVKEEANLFYIAVTRALHELVIYNQIN